MDFKIAVLDDITANQIAAGEVVERPYSVVKELVENSLDAGSNKITIHLEDGGIKSIKVIDNGVGMNSRDAKLAFERHATSKLKTIDDLDNLITLGFRGEALASIASISNTELVTRTKEDIVATSLNVVGGELIKSDELSSPVGTSVTVKDLFFNTPARKKHLKSAQRELSVVSDLISKLALANPTIGFLLANNSKVIYNFPSGLSLEKRIFDVFGTEVAKEMILITAKNDFFNVEGFIGRPTVSRSSRSHQGIFINNRYVKSQLISKAIESAYHTYLMVNRYPIFAIHLKVNPSLVDVNVHPTKMEVRFDKEKELQELFKEAVQTALVQKSYIFSSNRSYVSPQKITFDEKPQQEKIIFPPKDKRVEADLIGLSCKIERPVVESIKEEQRDLEFNYEYNQEARANFPYLLPLGQINNTYIVCQGEEGMYLIDQHAAHERILYEKFIEGEKAKSTSQQMLIPSTIDLKSGYSQILIENILMLNELGFIIEHFGGDTFIIRGVPLDLSMYNEKELLLDLLEEVKDSRSMSTTKLREKMVITMSCKGAIKANKRLEKAEILGLIKELNMAKQPFTCPHGRPTLILFDSYELEKKFKRIV